MSLAYKNSECVRIKLKFSETNGTQSYCQFTVDPKLTNFSVLIQLISTRFEITGELSINYLVMDKYGEQMLKPLKSDTDLDSAVIASDDPTLRLFIEVKPKSEENWDFVTTAELSTSNTSCINNSSNCKSFDSRLAANYRTQTNSTFLQVLSQQVEKTVNSLEKAIGIKTSNEMPRIPVNDAEFRLYMDKLGRIVRLPEFFQSVYNGGVEPSLRKVAWRILLNIYPVEMTGQERIALLTENMVEYRTLADTWKIAYREGRLTPSQMEKLALASVDVIRTDRNQPFYADGVNNQRMSQLFIMLATYSIYHPSIGYHQGMSNLASPLLVVQDTEGSAFVCFCALMQRIGYTFCPRNQNHTILQMQHLHDLLVFLDCELAQFLRHHHLGNMFFTERWLLLELVREFSFDHSFLISEVQWAALNITRLAYASEWKKAPNTSCSILTENKSANFFNKSSSLVTHNYNPSEVKLINSLIGADFAYTFPLTSENQPTSSKYVAKSNRSNSENNHNFSEGDPISMKDWVVELPPPDELGGGNPFLLFLCVSLLLEYRETIFLEVRDASDLFHLFQTKNKQHNHISIINRARSLFNAYLQDQETKRFNRQCLPHVNF